MSGLVAKLNGEWHERALYFYTFVVLAHWAEHITQAIQVYVLNWPVPQSLGLLGKWFPFLVRSEILHWGYAFFMIAGLFLLRPGFLGRGRMWWNVSLIAQGWHFIEHSILQAQAIAGAYLFGADKPISIVQVWIPRVELHLLYNAMVFIPMVIAMYYHLYPPADEQPAIDCTCSRRHSMAPVPVRAK